ncbi:hypothetical protein A3Q56_03812 [Intoshia linei]|uniref:tRNA (34-2'-O)-methyltransferase regulator WDR6 n=1 Tax=Intoshia linei TaxID=1819745 RepID=A0A177B2H0_9BILA|nr:hypothetical protein A3Q56_03812 [Intoshia linei]
MKNLTIFDKTPINAINCCGNILFLGSNKILKAYNLNTNETLQDVNISTQRNIKKIEISKSLTNEKHEQIKYRVVAIIAYYELLVGKIAENFFVEPNEAICFQRIYFESKISSLNFSFFDKMYIFCNDFKLHVLLISDFKKSSSMELDDYQFLISSSTMVIEKKAYILCTSMMGHVKLYFRDYSDVDFQSVLFEMDNMSMITCCKIDFNSNLAFIISDDWALSIYDLSIPKHPKLISRKISHTARPWCIDYENGAKVIATSGQDGQVILSDYVGQFMGKIAFHQITNILSIKIFNEKIFIGSENSFSSVLIDDIKKQNINLLLENFQTEPRKLKALSMSLFQEGALIFELNFIHYFYNNYKKIQIPQSYRNNDNKVNICSISWDFFCLFMVCNGLHITFYVIDVDFKVTELNTQHNLFNSFHISKMWKLNQNIFPNLIGFVDSINLSILSLDQKNLELNVVYLVPLIKLYKSKITVVFVDFYCRFVMIGFRNGTIEMRRLFIYCENENFKKILKCHNNESVMDIIQDNRFNRLFSCGRDGYLVEYSYSTDRVDYVFKIVMRYRIKLMNWIEKLFLCENELFILGFKANRMILLNHSNFDVQYDMVCGGGHGVRVFKLYLEDTIKTFAYYTSRGGIIKYKREPIYPLIHFTANMLHGKQINRSIIHKFNFDTKKYMVLFTCSEDCSLKISYISNKKLNIMCTLQDFSSSVKDITLIDIQNLFLLIAGGGQCELNFFVFSMLKLESPKILFRNNMKYFVQSCMNNSKISSSKINVTILHIRAIHIQPNIFVACALSDGSLSFYLLQISLNNFKIIPFVKETVKIESNFITDICINNENDINVNITSLESHKIMSINNLTIHDTHFSFDYQIRTFNFEKKNIRKSFHLLKDGLYNFGNFDLFIVNTNLFNVKFFIS